MNYDPPNINSNIFNASYFTDLGGSLTLADADLRYLKKSGGIVDGNLSLSGNLTATNINGILITTSQPNITSIGTLTSLNSSGIATITNTRINTSTNFNGVMDTASLVLRQPNNINGNKVSIDFSISTNVIDAANTATCSISHERIGVYQGDLIFSTKRVVTATSALVEALRISSTGSCSIANTSNSDFQLNLGSSGTGINTSSITSTSITGTTIIATSTLEVNGVSINSSNLAYLSGITAGSTTASKALVVDSNKDISGLNIINSNGIVLTPTNYTLTSPNISGCLWRSNSSRISGFREIDSNNFSWGYSGGGLWNDILVMSNSTYRITVNGDLNYTGSLRSSGTVVLDSSRNLTCNSASVRNNSQTSGTRVEYLSIGRETGTDYGAFSLQNYYQSATSQQANYCTFTPSLKTSLTSGYGICVNQAGQVSFQDVNAGGGSGGIKTAANIIGCVDVYGGKTNIISASHGYLQPDSGSPADYNGSSVSSRVGLFVENAIWCGDKVYSSSDNRLKRDIKTIPLEESKKLLNINAFSYRWKKDTEDHLEDIGFIAQDFLETKLEKIVSFCPSSDKERFPKGYSYGLEYQKVCVYQNELIKDLYVQMEELKNEILLLKDTTKKILSQKRLP